MRLCLKNHFFTFLLAIIGLVGLLRFIFNTETDLEVVQNYDKRAYEEQFIRIEQMNIQTKYECLYNETGILSKNEVNEDVHYFEQVENKLLGLRELSLCLCIYIIFVF